MRLLCVAQENRKFVVTNGGVRTLLRLVDLKDEKPRNDARQALSQILIVTNPSLLPYQQALDAVRPLLQTLESYNELLQFEAAMALTNLASLGSEVRLRILQGEGWRLFRELLFSENKQVQRTGLEGMCNLTMEDKILERFVEKKMDLELKIFLAFCFLDEDEAECDRGMTNAASGALAMLSEVPEIARLIGKHENFKYLPKLLNAAAGKDAALEHRAAAALVNVFLAGPDGDEKENEKENKEPTALQKDLQKTLSQALKREGQRALRSAEAKQTIEEALQEARKRGWS